MDWKQRLIEFRGKLSQEEFARLGKVATITVRSMERGSRPLTVPVLESLLRGIGSSLAEFFESKIPDSYPDPIHQNVHDYLQEILEANPEHAEYAQGIILNIEAIYEKLIRQRKAKGAAPPVEKKLGARV
jgi:transcriptional regulator with XRE-family HTH domain